MSTRTDPRLLGTWRAGPVWESCAFCDRSEDRDGSAVCRVHRAEFFPRDRQPAPRPLRRKRRRG